MTGAPLSERWDTDRDNQLRALAGQGMSASQISAEIGMTRNAVIGRMDRINLKSHNERADGPKFVAKRGSAGGISSSIKAKRHHMATAAGAPIEPHQISAALVEFNAKISRRQKKTIIQLGPEHCRFPLWEDGDTTRFYCGAKGADMPGKPFCTDHERFAYKPSTGAKPWMPGRS